MRVIVLFVVVTVARAQIFPHVANNLIDVSDDLEILPPTILGDLRGNGNGVAPTESCPCVPLGKCPTPEPPGIDIRIVNEVCSLGTERCCFIPPPPTPPPPPPPPPCGVRREVTKIEAGQGEANYGDYPWQVMIMTIPDEQYIGGGVLIDSNHVLTAAHKVFEHKDDPDLLKVRLGEWDYARKEIENFGYVESQVVEITIHRGFDEKNLRNDVALIRFAEAAPIAKYSNINTACLPEGPPQPGRQCFVTGWGKKLFDEPADTHSILREVDVPIVDSKDCEDSLRKTRLGRAFELSRKSFMCAGGEWGKDACTNDGGSPLVCRKNTEQWEVVGLVAWGIGCANSNVPGVYVNVFNYRGWIDEVMKKEIPTRRILY